jgi:hypothetical protein
MRFSPRMTSCKTDVVGWVILIYKNIMREREMRERGERER